MENNEFLNEENYQRGKKKIIALALIVLIVGLIIGCSLIGIGISKKSKVDSNYSDSNKLKMQEKLEKEGNKISQDIEVEKQNLISLKSELEAKIKPVKDEIKSLERESFTGFNEAYYAREDKIEELEKSIKEDEKSINIIDDALDESFNHCAFDNAKNNKYTSKYCSLKNNLKENKEKLENLDDEYSNFNKDFDSFDSIPFYMFGAFVIIASVLVAFSIYFFAKRREIFAFTTQQVMPVAQEGIEKMAPTIGKAGANITKEMAPAYGEAAKEISKGIKEGLKDSNKEEKTEEK